MSIQTCFQALSIWQPWASAIMCGAKPIENRTWFPPRAVVGTWIAIHAGKRQPELDDVYFVRDVMAAEVARGRTFPPTKAGPLSALLGLGFVAAAHHIEQAPAELRESPWAFGPVLWHLTEVRRLDEPILGVRGWPGLWPVLPEHATTLRGLLEAA